MEQIWDAVSASTTGMVVCKYRDRDDKSKILRAKSKLGRTLLSKKDFFIHSDQLFQLQNNGSGWNRGRGRYKWDKSRKR